MSRKKCFLIVMLCFSSAATAAQETPRPAKFSFKTGQTVWLEAYEFPSLFESLILRVMAHGDTATSQKPDPVF